MVLLQLLVEALLYYLACALVSRREHAPGLLRVFITVLLLAFVSGGVKAIIGDFWLASAIIFFLNIFILLFGLGIGILRTVVAAILVIVLRSLLEWAFGGMSRPELFS
jgi:hypothetical protein